MTAGLNFRAWKALGARWRQSTLRSRLVGSSSSSNDYKIDDTNDHNNPNNHDGNSINDNDDNSKLLGH
jgi:hypothetical protein